MAGPNDLSDQIAAFGPSNGPFAPQPTVGTGAGSTTFNRIPMGPDGNPVTDALSFAKRKFRAGVGLDENGSSTQDITSPDFARGMQSLGLPQLPESVARGIGGFADTMGDPAGMVGMGAQAASKGMGLINKLGGLAKGESGAVDLNTMKDRLANIRALRTGSTEAGASTPRPGAPAGPGVSPLSTAMDARLDRSMGTTKLGLSMDSQQMKDLNYYSRLEKLRSDPQALGEIMKPVQNGSQYLDSGVQATVLRNPESSQVYRIAQGGGNGDPRLAHLPPDARLNFPEILQPSRPDVVAGNTRMETLPFGQVGQDTPQNFADARRLYNSMRDNRGYTPKDVINRDTRNIIYHNGEAYIGDPGFMDPNGAQSTVPTSPNGPSLDLGSPPSIGKRPMPGEFTGQAQDLLKRMLGGNK